MELNEVEAVLLNIEEIDELPDVSEYDYLGLGYPVYSWGMPTNVLEFAKSLPNAKQGQKCFVFATYGGAGLYAIKEGADILKEKGYQVLRSRGFKMPESFTISFIGKLADNTEEGKKKLLEKADNEIPGYVKKILEGDSHVEATGWIFGHLFSVILRSLFRSYGAVRMGSQYRVNDKCTSCKLCARTCPVGNIEMVEGRPVFGEKCILCCRCYNVCPVKAIDHPGSPDPDFRYKAPGYKPPVVNEV